MEYIILVVVAFYIGWKAQEIFMAITFGKMLRDAGITDKDLSKFASFWAPKMGMETPEELVDTVEIKCEQHGEVLYVFKKDNDQFLGQGKDKAEILEILRSKFKDVKFTITEEDGAQLLGLKEQP